MIKTIKSHAGDVLLAKKVQFNKVAFIKLDNQDRPPEKYKNSKSIIIQHAT